MKTKVENMVSLRGYSVPNQFIITTKNGKIFQSYNSVICIINNNGKTTLDEKYWDYSTTTSKYRNIFLGETKKETQAKIDTKEYILDDLNGEQ